MTDATGAAAAAGTVTYIGGQKAPAGGMTINNDTFLKLLVAQLKYQDPLEPQTDTAFVTQLAQMTSLEQMQQMNLSISGSQAYGMIGKYVYAEVLDEKTGITNCCLGLVSSVILREGVPYVVVEDRAVPASKVIRVFGSPLIEAEPPQDSENTADG